MPKEQVGRWMIAKFRGCAENDLPDALPMPDSPITIVDKSSITIEQIENVVKRVREKRIVIVDHLQRVATPGRETRNQEIGEVARRLKNIAKDYRCTVLALSQLNRKGDESERPSLPLLRDSGEIEHVEADVIVFNWAQDKDKTGRMMNLACYMAKNRGGQLNERWVEWDKKLKTFRDEEIGFTY